MYLIAGLIKDIKEKRELKQKQRLKWFSIGMAFFGGLMLILAFFAFNKLTEAKSNELKSNYNLAKVFEEKAKTKIEELKKNIEKINTLKSSDELTFYKSYKKKLIKEAFLYALDSQINELPGESPIGNSKLLSELLVLGTEELLTREELTRISYREIGDITDFEISSSGKYISVISSDSKVRLWNTISGNMVSKIDNENGKIRSLAFNPDDKVIFSGSEDGFVSIWNIETGIKISNIANFSKAINNIMVIEEDKILLLSTEDGHILLWDIENNKIRKKINAKLNIEKLAYKNKDMIFFSRKTDDLSIVKSSIYVYDLKNNLVIEKLVCNNGDIDSISYTGGKLITNALFGSCLWSVEGTIEEGLSFKSEKITDSFGGANIAFNKNSELLAYSDNEKIISFSDKDGEVLIQHPNRRYVIIGNGQNRHSQTKHRNTTA